MKRRGKWWVELVHLDQFVFILVNTEFRCTNKNSQISDSRFSEPMTIKYEYKFTGGKY
jgi:hypothetical protein